MGKRTMCVLCGTDLQDGKPLIKADFRKLVKEAFEAGYESGHNDTVESQYGDAGELADEYVDDLEVE